MKNLILCVEIKNVKKKRNNKNIKEDIEEKDEVIKK
jgi:hypothetical protein